MRCDLRWSAIQVCGMQKLRQSQPLCGEWQSDEVTIHAANRDLHSGYYGGAAQNPIHILSKILADLHDESGAVTLEGFYDGVEENPRQYQADVGRPWFLCGEFLGSIGLSMPSGEANRSVLEQDLGTPDCRGQCITGGYTGDGFKTVIAAQALAKVSFRLVGKQDPDKVAAAFANMLRNACRKIAPHLSLPMAAAPRRNSIIVCRTGQGS